MSSRARLFSSVRIGVGALFIALSAAILDGQEAPGSVFSERFETDKENQMMRAYLREQVRAAAEDRRQVLEGLESGEAIVQYQARLREFFRDTVDLDSFERGPLNARVTGRLEREGYVVEKVIFESLPGFHVTGNLYLPEGDGPFPGILHPCGHTDNGKAAGVYQKVNILLVQQGCAVLCYDPIGQGERKQLLDPETGKSLRSSTGEHQALGVAPVLIGRGLASYMIWDGMRGIDYLQSRPEIDPGRIGCTGNSGGGNMTSFLMALDDRIVAAAPGCFMTTTVRKNESPGPGDPEQNLFAQIREGLDHPDFAIMRAPRPTLILAATEDFVPIEGTWEAFRQAKRIYTRLGFPERIDLVEAPEKHGYSQRLREGAARFFVRWLRGGETSEVFESDQVAVEADRDLICTPKGQVLALEGERSLLDLNQAHAESLKGGRQARWESMSEQERRETVREVGGIRTRLGEPLVNGGSEMVFGSGSGFRATRSEWVETEPGIAVPLLRTHAQGNQDSWPDNAPIDLVLLDSAWEGLHTPPSDVIPERALEAGRELIIANLRDSGFSKTKNWRFHGADWWIGYMLGRSYLAMRTEDLVSLARLLRAEGSGSRPLHLHADAEFVAVAIHAAAIEPELFDSLTLWGGITSWESVIDSRDPLIHLHSVVPGGLKHYDLPDLMSLYGEEKITRQPAAVPRP